MWLKVPQNQCTTQFGRDQVAKVISLQSFLVDRIPFHMKHLCPCHCLSMSEEDFNVISESGVESVLHDNEDVESDNLPEEESEAELPFLPLRRSTSQK